MGTITGIHGIAQQYQSGPELTSTWFDALRGGLNVAGFRAKAESLQSNDLTVAFFGDLFRPEGTMGPGREFDVSDLNSKHDRDLLEFFYEAAAGREPTIRPTEDEMGIAGGLQQMLRRLARSKALAGIVEKLFVRDLKQVNWFLDDPDTKERVLSRVAAEVSTDTVILIGHSLGSVVAYEYLCQYQPGQVHLFVTVGSPLGIPNLVFDRLTPKPIEGRGAWPGHATRWVNVADEDDVVALVKDLAGLFCEPAGTEFRDRLVDNGNQPHMISRYLNSKQVGEAVGSVL